jgi:hypothetical protein
MSLFPDIVELERSDILPQFRDNVFRIRQLYKTSHYRSVNYRSILNDYLRELETNKSTLEQTKNKRDKTILSNIIKDLEEKIVQTKNEIREALIIKRQIQKERLWNINPYFDTILKERGDKVFNKILLLLEQNRIDRPVIENLLDGLNLKDLSVLEKINRITEILSNRNIIIQEDYIVYRILVLLLGIYTKIQNNVLPREELPREDTKETNIIDFSIIDRYLMNENIYESGFLNNPRNIDEVERILGIDTLESSSLKNSRLKKIMKRYHPDKNDFLPRETSTKIMAFLSEFQTIIGIKMKYLKYKEKYINLKKNI